MGGDRLDKYGGAYLELVLATTDGSYVDIEDKEQLASYVIVGQDIAPNAEMLLTYRRNSEGEEYSNLVDTQTYDKITLTLKRLE